MNYTHHSGDGLIKDGLNQDEIDFEALIDSARAGDAEAMSQLIQHCRPFLLAIANVEIGDEIAAKIGASDIVQNSMLSAQRCIGQFHGQDREALLAWLRGILLNDIQQTRRHYRTAKREVTREMPLSSASQMGPGVPLIDSADSPSSAAVQREQEDRLQRAMNELSDDQRKVIELRTWQRLQFAEIGEQMNGRSSDSVRKLWARSIVRLQELMNKASRS